MARLETDQTSKRALEQERVRDLLRAAMIRQGDLEDRGSPELELREALAIGEELNIPAEQVRAAYAEQQTKEVRLQRRTTLRASLLRRQRVAAAMLSGLTVFLGLQFWWLDPPNFQAHLLLVLPFLAIAVFMARAPISEERLDQAELVPIGGVCRICFQPAYSVNAVYCARHRP